MSFNLGSAPPGSLDAPSVKRQKTASGYNSNTNSPHNTNVYNSDNDDGDGLFDGFIPDTPGRFQTQATQILDRPGQQLFSNSPPRTPTPSVQVPASSPFTGRDSPVEKPVTNLSGVSIQSGYFQKANTGSIGPGQRPNTGVNPAGLKLMPAGSAAWKPQGMRSTPAMLAQMQNSSPQGRPVSNQMQNGVQSRPIGNYMQNGMQQSRSTPNLAMSMAPAGTAYRPPHGIVNKPPTPAKPNYITIEGGSSDEDDQTSANIKPTAFGSKSANNSFTGTFGGSAGVVQPVSTSGNTRFQEITQNAVFRGMAQANGFSGASSIGRNGMPVQNNSGLGRPQVQARPAKALPVQDESMSDISDDKTRENVMRLKMIYPGLTVTMAKNALIIKNGSLEDAAELIVQQIQEATDAGRQSAVITIDDDEIESPQGPKATDYQMKRGLNAPLMSIRDRYSSTQNQAPRPIATPPKAKKRLVQGRRNPSSPAIQVDPSPLKAPSPAQYDSYDETDSGVDSGPEGEDPYLEDRVLKYFNTCELKDLIELCNITKEIAEVMLAARPFKSLDIARTVENTKTLKSGKKSARAPVGDRIVDTAIDMFRGYEAIDTLVAKCKELGKPLAEEMARWGFDVFGAEKGELEMTSLDDIESQRDSGIGSPSSGANSNNGDDDVKIVSSTRKRSNVQFLKKPDLMAESCELKDYQVVGLNWLALMYRQKLSCILADEMGLGKTCQVIAFLSHLVETGHSGPHLVVCPGSTLENWLREFQKFAPQLAVEPYHGPQKERGEMADTILLRRAEINVVVTTYDMAAKKEDNKFMRRLRPDVSSLLTCHIFILIPLGLCLR